MRSDLIVGVLKTTNRKSESRIVFFNDREEQKKTKVLESKTLTAHFVALPGFEPGQAVPETDVLPLHHKAIA